MTLYIYARSTNQEPYRENSANQDIIASAINADCKQVGEEVYITDVKFMADELKRVNGRLFKRLGYDKIVALKGVLSREYVEKKIQLIAGQKIKRY